MTGLSIALIRGFGPISGTLWDHPPEQVTSLCSQAQWVFGMLGQRRTAANVTDATAKKNMRCFMLMCEVGNGELVLSNCDPSENVPQEASFAYRCEGPAPHKIHDKAFQFLVRIDVSR